MEQGRVVEKYFEGKVMTSIHLKAHVDKDGILKLKTPIQGVSDQDVEVTLVIQPQPSKGSGEGFPQSSGWSQGFSWRNRRGLGQGAPLTRPPQGKFEIREELDWYISRIPMFGSIILIFFSPWLGLIVANKQSTSQWKSPTSLTTRPPGWPIY